MASLSDAFPIGAGVHLAMPLSHLYATLVGIGFFEVPSSTAAPIAKRHADLFADATWSSRALAFSVADLASDVIQKGLFALTACLSATAHRTTLGCCCCLAPLVRDWCAANALARCPPSDLASNCESVSLPTNLTTSSALRASPLHIHEAQLVPVQGFVSLVTADCHLNSMGLC